VLKEQRALQGRLADVARLDRFIGDLDTLLEFEGEDIDQDFGKTLEDFRPFVEEIEIKALLGGELDVNNAIVTIHPGAGGTESQDWAEMLLRMYLRWAQNRGFTTVLNEATDGDEARTGRRGVDRLPQRGEPVVERVGERPAERGASDAGVLEQRPAVELGGHRAPVGGMGRDLTTRRAVMQCGADSGSPRQVGQMQVRRRRCRARRCGCG